MTYLKSIDTSGEVPILTWNTPSKKDELTDLLTEAINAVIEEQDRYARDWTIRCHRDGWAAQRRSQ